MVIVHPEFKIPYYLDDPNMPRMEEFTITLEVDGAPVTIVCSSFRVVKYEAVNFMDDRRAKAGMPESVVEMQHGRG